MLRLCCSALLASVLLCELTSGQSPQSSPAANRDPTALAILTQAFATAGGEVAIGAIQDFNGSGQITYYWGGQEVTGSVSVRGRSADQFRLDAALPSGTRSWVVSNRGGELKEVDGKISSIPPHNAMTLGSLTLPYIRLLKATTDGSTSLQDGGEVTTSTGQKMRKIHVHHDFDPSFGNNNPVNHLLDADYFIDVTTNLLVSIRNQAHTVESMASDVPHEITLSDYRNVNGLMVPFGIAEYVGGQRVWVLQLSSIKFNTGLVDSDFKL